MNTLERCCKGQREGRGKTGERRIGAWGEGLKEEKEQTKRNIIGVKKTKSEDSDRRGWNLE